MVLQLVGARAMDAYEEGAGASAGAAALEAARRVANVRGGRWGAGELLFRVAAAPAAAAAEPGL